MARPILGETAQGAVNSSNRTFKTAYRYKAGSLQVWRNGLMGQRELVDGWTELGGQKFRLDEAPVTGDQIQVYYIALGT
jgi:hypothetical protein